MRGHIPQDVIDRVLASVDIVEVVSRHVPLEKKGRTWKALCPFHEEKTASFTVNPERGHGTFKCFGCGKGGNAFGFLMEREGLSFPEAVRLLAAEKGIVVPDSRGDGGGDPSRFEAIRAAIALAQDLYVRTLHSPAGDSARAYLAQRGYSVEAAKRFGLGLSPAGWDGLLQAGRAKGMSASVLEDAGLVLVRESGTGHYDRFRNRLMFPVADAQGRIVTWGARALDPEDVPKYLNGPETPVFRKGDTLYALDRARDAIRKGGAAILMEGYTDVLMAHLHGLEGAVAGMGTSFTTHQAKLLKRHADRVVLLYDGDQAGRLAAEKSIEVLLEEGLEVRVALLPEGKDVDEVLLEEGRERVDAIVAGALDFFDFKFEQLAKRLDLTSARGKATAAEELASGARRVKGLIEQGILFRRIAERLDVREEHLRAAAAAAGEGKRRGLAVPAALSALDPAGRARVAALFREQERLVAGAIFRPEWTTAVRGALPLDEIEHEGLRALYAAACLLQDDEGAVTASALVGRVADDPTASSALAGLPDDVPFDDWLPDALEMRAKRRAERDRRDAVLKGLREEALPPAAPPAP